MTDEPISISEQPAQPVTTAPGPAAVPPAPPRRPRWLWYAVGAAVVVVLLGIGVVVGAVAGGSKFTAHGELELTDATGTVNYDGQHCRGVDGYNDIREGTQVVITDQSGTVIATTQLDTGLPLGGACAFKFSASVPAGKTFYGVAVSHRGTVQYREADLKSGVHLTLG